MHASRRKFISAGAALTAAAAVASRAYAAGYPARAITFICPWSAGGTADVTMRALCTAAARELGQPIVVDNKVGASGMIGLKALASAKPDGYTIGQIPISVTRFSQLGMVQLDPLKDLTYLARVSGQTFGIAVRADAPWKTVQELVAAARAKPDTITYAIAGLGGATHVGMEEFAAAAGAKLRAIPYKGGAEALAGLMGGQVDVLADSSSWAPHVKSGKLRLLATWGAQRTHDFANVPTLREAGWDVVVDAPNGIGGPRGMPAEVTTKLRSAFKAAAASPEFVQACARIDAPVMYLDAPEYEKFVATTYARDKQLIEKLHLRELLAKG